MEIDILKYKVKAAILPTVITLSVLITIMVSSIILLAYYRSMALATHEIKERLMVNAESGINYILAQPEKLTGKVSLDLFDQEKDSVILETKPWGLFDLALSTAYQGNNFRRKAALFGVAPDKYAKSALYLTDENRPLSISGNTLLKGKCYLPKAGVRTAYINQQSFTRSKLVDGLTLESDQYLPKLNKKYTDRLEISDLLNKGVEISAKDIIVNSFYDEGYILKVNSLESIIIRGHVIIYSAGTLTIENTAQLDNVIVAGEKVILKDGFKGNVQVFAKDTIIVETNVHLGYPSLLIVNGKSNHSRIEVREKSVVEGIIIIPENDAEFLGNLVTIHKGATVKGQVYAGGLVDHQGTVEGSIICRRFFLKTPSTLYENHLLDATIDNSLLSPYYVSSPILSASDKKIVVQWLR